MKSFNALVITVVILASFHAPAAVIEAWVHTYSVPTNVWNQPVGVAFDASSNLIAVRVSGDYYLTKYAVGDGRVFWEKRISNRIEGFTLDSKGNVIVTGSSEDFGPANCYTVKYAATDGALLWKQRHSVPGLNSFASGGRVAVDAHDHVVVAGRESTGTNWLFYTAKYAASEGALLWEQHFTVPNTYGWPTGIAVDSIGDVVVTGRFTVQNADASPAGVGTVYNYTIKYAGADGSLLWQQHYNRLYFGFGDYRGPDMALDGSGNVIIAELNYDGLKYVAKYAAADGTILWEKRPDGWGNAGDRTVAVDGTGHVVLLGQSSMAKYAGPDGAVIWERRYGETNSDGVLPTSAAFDGNGNVVMMGVTWKMIANERVENGFYAAKYAGADGALLWEKRFEVTNPNLLPANPRVDPFSQRLALGPIGVVAISGTFSSSDNSDVSFVTIVYRENLPALLIGKVPTGIQLRFSGVAGQSYNVERATNIIGPWSNIATVTPSADGKVEYLDTSPFPAGAFYRVSTPASP